MILDGHDLYGSDLAGYLSWRELRAIGIRRGWTPPALADVADVDPLPVWIQQGSWVVTCPECKDRPDLELQTIWLSGPLAMFCTICGNVATDGRLRPVALPDDRDEIVARLSVRPLHQRTWLVGEPLTELIAQNVQNGWGEEGG